MERGLVLWNISDEDSSPLVVIFKFVVSLVIVYLGYISYRHISNFGDIMAGTYSTGGKIINVILWPVAVIVVVIAAIIVIYLVILIFKFLYIAIPEVPGIMRHEAEIVRRIWDNRGFGKYSLFGGFAFYAKLRQRVFAYFFAFLSIGIVTWYFAFKQHEYEKTYWKIHFYYNEPTPEFIFKPNTSYTFESSADLYSIWLDNRECIVSKYMEIKDSPRVLSLLFPNKWHVKFSDTTQVRFIFYQDPINQIFSQSFEIWAGKEEGLKITYNDFIYEGVKKNPNSKRYIRN